MLKIIVYEDNPIDLKKVSATIDQTIELHNTNYDIQTFNQYTDELKTIIQTTKDKKIYILDVEVQETSGIEVASQIREYDWQSIIIFITAYPKYKEDVIYSRLAVLDYIQKQHFNPNRLEETLSVALKILECEKYFIFTSNNVEYQLLFNEILYIEKIPLTKKCQIITDRGLKVEVNLPLHEIKTQLDKRFYQTHKSCIVNVQKIQQINHNEGKIIFTNGTSTYLLSTRRQKGLKEYVKLFK